MGAGTAGTWTRLGAALLVATSAAALAAPGRSDKEDLRKALKDDGLVGDWNYDDIDGAFARAAREKKPVCVVFR